MLDFNTIPLAFKEHAGALGFTSAESLFLGLVFPFWNVHEIKQKNKNNFGVWSNWMWVW